MSTTIYLDHATPGGRTVRYNLDITTNEAALLVGEAFENGGMVEIPNEDGGEPIFVNPERIATIVPRREES